jgi:hypothetical protein
MSFAYKPMTEAEAMKARFDLMKDGDYDAVIEKSEAKISGSGNSMIDLSLAVYDENGVEHHIRDFLIFTSRMQWKAGHCADSAGLSDEYLNNTFKPEMLVNKNVRVRVRSQEGNEIPADKLKGKPAGSKYPDKNVIDDYLVRAAKSAPTNSPDFNDDVPF